MSESFLEKISGKQAIEVARLYSGFTDVEYVTKAAELGPLTPSRYLSRTLKNKELKPGQFAHVVAETKKQSPSAGIINENVNPVKRARMYDFADEVAAVSVHTNPAFGGSMQDLRDVRKVTGMSILQKDFLHDPAQVYQAVVEGADSVLLIVKYLDLFKERNTVDQIRRLQSISNNLGMDALVEVCDMQDLEKALEADSSFIQVNSRDLHTFDIDLKRARQIMQQVPYDKVLMAASGMNKYGDVKYLCNGKRKPEGLLIGTVLSDSDNLRETLKNMAYRRMSKSKYQDLLQEQTQASQFSDCSISEA